jgi:hypothetical protein
MTSAMMAWISGTHDPQLVPHLRRLPISTVRGGGAEFARAGGESDAPHPEA